MNEHQKHAYSIAEQVWGDAADTAVFMNTPHALLGGKAPLDVAATEDGAKQVEGILEKVRWGLPR